MERTGWAESEVNLWHILMTHEHPRQRAPQGKISPDGVFLTRIVIDQVLQALEGEPWRDVVPVVRQAKDAVMLDLPVSHRERVEAFLRLTLSDHEGANLRVRQLQQLFGLVSAQPFKQPAMVNSGHTYSRDVVLSASAKGNGFPPAPFIRNHTQFFPSSEYWRADVRRWVIT